MPAVRRRRRRFPLGLALDAVLVALLAGLYHAPQALSAWVAWEWTRFHHQRAAPQAGAGHEARQAGRWAARALDAEALLPWSRRAVSMALDAARVVEPDDPAAAREVYAELRAALERARSSPFRGIGLGALVGEARRLEQAAR
jgi:hypothetical protein